MQKIYNISSLLSFSDVLAKHLVNKYEKNPLNLSDVIIYLPNRRACRNLQNAFIRVKGEKSLMLPTLVPIGDIDEEDLLLSLINLSNSDDFLDLLPEISNFKRLFLLTRLILSRPSQFGIEKPSEDQACYLANSLVSLLDNIYLEELSFDELQKLAPAEFASHWQDTLDFLKIITEYWPQILKDEHCSDRAERVIKLIDLKAKFLSDNKIDKDIIVAGQFATYPAMLRLLSSIHNQPNSQIILQGLDRHLDNQSWDIIEENHPQYDTKKILDSLNLSRSDVLEWQYDEKLNIVREKLVSEVMRPAKTSYLWQNLKEGCDKEAIKNINALEFEDSSQEAIAISLIMRECLDIEGKTCSLVTNDRFLARRVANNLLRWGIKIDDSAGIPLNQTPNAIFMRLIISTIQSNFAPNELLSLIKHPLFSLGLEKSVKNKIVSIIDKKYLRGPRIDNGLEGLLEKIEDDDKDVSIFIKKLIEATTELTNITFQKETDFADIIKSHIILAEELTKTNEVDGKKILWSKDIGNTLSNFFSNILDNKEYLGTINPQVYLGLLEALMTGITVRAKFGLHPRLSILGPIEARLQQSDITIIGGVVEGIWPKLNSADPWLSRPMKQEYGYPLPEKAIGILAKDFTDLLSAKEVYITSSNVVEGSPAIKSRWMMRLETVLKAYGFAESDIRNKNHYISWAKQIDKPSKYIDITPPAPCPPLSARRRELSATWVEKLMRDPYSVYAKYILSLNKLDDVDADAKNADYGNIIHDILEEFSNKYPKKLPDNAYDELIRIGKHHFYEKVNISASIIAFWWPRFEKIAKWMVGFEKSHRITLKNIISEVWGTMTIPSPKGNFTIRAKADRIDEHNDGKLTIIDYKTGQSPSTKSVMAFYSPQLLIEALIAERGGFENLSVKEVDSLLYLKLNDKNGGLKSEPLKKFDMKEVLEQSYSNLTALIRLYDDEKTCYYARPNPAFAPKYSDYEHLARVKEWEASNDE